MKFLDLFVICGIIIACRADEVVVTGDRLESTSNHGCKADLNALKSRLERLKGRVISLQDAIYSIESCSLDASSSSYCTDSSVINRLESILNGEEVIIEIEKEKKPNVTPEDNSLLNSILSFFASLLSIILSLYKSIENAWLGVLGLLGIFDKFPHILTTFVALFVNQQLQELSHHRRDYSDRMSITWHYYENADGEDRGKNCVAITEASLNLKDTFQDDPVLYQKIKQAILVTHDNYPPNCILVGRRLYWSQYWNSWVYYGLTILLSIFEHLLSFLGVDLKWLSWIHGWISERYERNDALYTPHPDDHRLFKRRLRNFLSENVKNSRWPKHVKDRSFAVNHNHTASPLASNVTNRRNTRSTSFVPPPLVHSASSRYPARTISRQRSNNADDKIFTLTEEDRERIFAIPIYEKDDNFEVKELKIILIYGKDLLFCADNRNAASIKYRYPHWRLRDQEIRKFGEFLQTYTYNSDRYEMRGFWTDLVVPEFN